MEVVWEHVTVIHFEAPSMDTDSFVEGSDFGKSRWILLIITVDRHCHAAHHLWGTLRPIPEQCTDKIMCTWIILYLSIVHCLESERETAVEFQLESIQNA